MALPAGGCRRCGMQNTNRCTSVVNAAGGSRFIASSFETICGSGRTAPFYLAGQDWGLVTDSLLLLDSGAHYNAAPPTSPARWRSAHRQRR